MAIEPVFEKITCTKENKSVKERIKVECRSEIESSSVKKIINLSSSADLISAQIHDGKILYKGKIIYFVCYEDVEGDIRKSEYGVEFNGETELPCDVMDYKIDASAIVEKTDVNLSAPKFSVTSYVLANFDVNCNLKVEALIGGNGLIVKSEELESLESLGERETFYEIEEEFEITTEVKEVINHKAEAVITSCIAGVGCIIVDGEAYLSLLLLKDGEHKEIIKQQKTFPFRVEIESEEAMPSNLCTAKVKVADFKTDISVSGGEGTSLAEAKLKLHFTAEAFDSKKHVACVDAFNLEENVDIEKIDARLQIPCSVRCEEIEIRETATVEIFEDNAVLCATTSESVEIISAEQSDNQLKVSGVVSLNAVMRGEDGRFFSRKASVPIECKVNVSSEEKITKIQAVVKKSSAKIISNEELELCATLAFTFSSCKEKNYAVISSITPCGKKQRESSAISVYIASENESLWGLAKRLNVCPDELLSSNKELQFPLSGEERIVVFRQK